MQKNPHFDDNLVLWDDAYSGRYTTPEGGYKEQFDLQWAIASSKLDDYYHTPGASYDDIYINDRIIEWTGKSPEGRTEFYDQSSGTRKLDYPISIDMIRGKNCIDIGCGMGRWTKTMQKLGAKSVTSVDASASAIKNVSQFNPNVVHTDIMLLPKTHPELKNKFDFANFWGVAMCTHDPLQAFMSASSTVKSGGNMFLMVYTPGYHDHPLIMAQRKIFHGLKTTEERLNFVDTVFHRHWDSRYPFKENIKNKMRDLLRCPKGSRVGVLDMLEPFYNWVISEDTIKNWCAKAGFTNYIICNVKEKNKCALHVLLMGKK